LRGFWGITGTGGGRRVENNEGCPGGAKGGEGDVHDSGVV